MTHTERFEHSRKHTVLPIGACEVEDARYPEFTRLPKAGTRCRLCGLSRATLNELILGARPKVRSVVLRKAGHIRGIRLIVFPGNPLLCVGQSNHEFDTCLREEWRGRLGSMALIVPSPMSARTGSTKDGGKTSKHTLANTGLRRFLIVECDFARVARDGKTPTVFAPLIDKLGADHIDTLDMGAAVVAHLARSAPLAAAVHTGGKSLHGWFYCAGRDEGRLEKFMRDAVRIGADRATWSRSQFVRMPDGQRDNGKRQVTYYFNPEVVK